MIEMANAPTITLVIAAFTRAPNKLLRNIENERKNRRILRIFDPPGVLRTVGAVGEEREGWNLWAPLSQRRALLTTVFYQPQKGRKSTLLVLFVPFCGWI